jgi:hypothetical protein
MEILLITDRSDLNLRIEAILKSVLLDNKLVVESPKSNISFLLTNILLERKGHLDLIIIDDYELNIPCTTETFLYSDVNMNNCINAIDFIRNNSNETYSNSNYYLRNIPLIKICREYDDVTYNEKSYIYFDHCLDLHVDTYLEIAVSKAIAFTRDLIISDLKTLGMMSDNKYHLIKTNFALYHYDNDLRILSKSYIEKQKQLNLYWFEYPLEEVGDAINRYLEMVSMSRKFNYREELKIHYFFRQNPYFILRDKYSNYYYGKELVRRDGEPSIKPDFILKPSEFNQNKKTEIFEIKLPDEGIVKKKRFHQNFYTEFWEHLVQVKDYQDYFQLPDVNAEIFNKLGYLPTDYLFTLLVGGSENKEQNRNILSKLSRQFNLQDINILTYDELLDYQIRYFEREKRIKGLTKYIL